MKFGGSVLTDGHAIRRAAEQIKTEVEKGNRVVAVVSALKGETDRLLEITNAISHKTPPSVKDHIIRLGEEQSTRLLSSALNLIGVPSEELTVDKPGWPIITDCTFGNAEPLIGECEKAVKHSLEPFLLSGITPVVSGFVGRSTDGEVTTLGRGGSDTTATVLARCLGADELILVKDVGGVFTADPNKVKNAEKLEKISTREAHHLSSTGAKVVHDKVFRYGNSGLGIRLISEGDDLSGNGTLIEGPAPEIDVQVNPGPVHKFTLVGDKMDWKILPDAVNRITEIGGIVRSTELHEGSLSILVSHDAKESLVALHGLVGQHDIQGITARENLKQVSITGIDIERVRREVWRIASAPSVHGVRFSRTGVSITLDSIEPLENVLSPLLELVTTLP